MFPPAVKISLGKTQQPPALSAPCQLLARSAAKIYKKYIPSRALDKIQTKTEFHLSWKIPNFPPSFTVHHPQALLGSHCVTI